jgi:tetratricopeptide (TPR) repeat protein
MNVVNAQVRQRWMGKIEALCEAENWKYAQFLCQEMLSKEPNFVDARRILNRARQYTACPQKFQRILSLAKNFLKMLYYMIKIKTKHRELLESMDELLNTDPHNVFILRLFAETMSGFGFFETTIFSIECIPEDKRNEDDWLLMGEAFLGSNDFQMAVDIANKVMAKSADNIRARDLLWQSSVEQSMGVEKM